MGRCQAGEQTVVVAAPTSQPDTIRSEGNAGNHREVDLLVVHEWFANGFQNMERPRPQLACTLVHSQFQVIAHYDGQQHTLAFGACLADEVAGIYFIGKRMVEQYDLGLLPEGVFCEFRNDSARQNSPLLNGAGCLAASYLLP
jgi:hypothetical protein